MKSFWTGAVAAVIIAAIAGVALNAVKESSAQKYSTENVRLN